MNGDTQASRHETLRQSFARGIRTSRFRALAFGALARGGRNERAVEVGVEFVVDAWGDWGAGFDGGEVECGF